MFRHLIKYVWLVLDIADLFQLIYFNKNQNFVQKAIKFIDNNVWCPPKLHFTWWQHDLVKIVQNESGNHDGNANKRNHNSIWTQRDSKSGHELILLYLPDNHCQNFPSAHISEAKTWLRMVIQATYIKSGLSFNKVVENHFQDITFCHPTLGRL